MERSARIVTRPLGTRTRLPSPSTCFCRAFIWYTVARKFPVSYRGLSPLNNHARDGRTHAMDLSRGSAVN